MQLQSRVSHPFCLFPSLLQKFPPFAIISRCFLGNFCNFLSFSVKKCLANKKLRVSNASTTLIDYIAFKVCNFDFKVCILILIFVILILEFAIAKQSSATLSLYWWTNPTSQIEFSPRKFEWCPTWWYLTQRSNFYRTQVRSKSTYVSDWLTDSLTHSPRPCWRLNELT